MTAEFVSYMEQYAYTVAKRELCINDRASMRIAMPEMFDLIAGSETGAIIATTLVLPNPDYPDSSSQKNKYFADTAVTWFANNTDTLYHTMIMSVWTKILISLVFIIIFGILVYKGTEKYYTVADFDSKFEDLKTLLRYRKKEAKKQKKGHEHEKSSVEEEELHTALENIHKHVDAVF